MSNFLESLSKESLFVLFMRKRTRHIVCYFNKGFAVLATRSILIIFRLFSTGTKFSIFQKSKSIADMRKIVDGEKKSTGKQEVTFATFAEAIEIRTLL